MVKKLCHILLIFVLLFMGSLPATAMKTETYQINISNTAELINGRIADTSLVLNAGKATYEFTLPFYSDCAMITSLGNGQKIKISADGFTEEFELSSENTKCIFPTPLRVGEKTFIIETSGNTEIFQITLNEITEDKSYEPSKLDTTPYEDALSTAFILKEGSPVIKVNSSTRYIDYDDINVCPIYFNSSLYIPARTLADSIGCYFEYDKDNDFILLRKSNIDLVILKDDAEVLRDDKKEKK